MKIDDFVAELEAIAPLETQEEWDNSGWQLKLTDGEITKVMVALEINRQVIYDAVLNDTDLIITHHPNNINLFLCILSAFVVFRQYILLIFIIIIWI